MKVAITGVALRLPTGIDSLDKFWKALIDSRNLTSQIITPRWPSALQKKPYYKNMSDDAFKHFGQLEGIELFDRKAFKLSALETINLDPQHRLLLELSWQALEDGKYPAFRDKSLNAGVFVGLCSNDYNQLLIDTNSKPATPYDALGSTHSTGAGRISHTFNLSGPAISFDTACSSSNVALNSAIQSIQNDECECAIVAGTNLIIHPSPTASFTKAGMLSPSFQCQPFESSADGYVRSEGAVALLLKPFEKAVSDKNTIYATIESSVVNHDGQMNTLTTPNSHAQIGCIQKAILKAGISSNDLSYIETHGTGTQVGDQAEVDAINTIFKQRNKHNPLYLGACKSLVGHTETVSGLVSIVKTILTMKHRQIPANRQKKPQFIEDRFNSGIIYSKSKVNLDNKNSIYAGISCYGFSGTNSHIILKSHTFNSINKYPDSTHLSNKDIKLSTLEDISLTISSYSEKHLQVLAQHYVTLIEKNIFNRDKVFELIELRSTYFQFKKTLTFTKVTELLAQLKAIYFEDSTKQINISNKSEQQSLSIWPFDKKKYWIDISRYNVSPKTKKHDQFWSLKTSLPDGTALFEKAYTPKEIQNLTGHKINVTPVIPATEYLALLSHVVDGKNEFQKFTLPSSLIKLKQSSLTLQVHLKQNKNLTLATIYLNNSTYPNFKMVASAEYTPSNSTTIETIDIVNSERSITEGRTDFYSHLYEAGLKFTGEFKSLSHITKMGELYIGHYSSDSSSLKQASTLDMPFQCISFACRHLKQNTINENNIFVPSAINQIDFINRDSSPKYCVVKIQHELKSEIIFDATIYDKTDTAICQYQGAKLVRIPLPQFDSKPTEPIDLYISKWKECPLSLDAIPDIKSNVQFICLKTGRGIIEHLFDYISKTKGYSSSRIIDIRTDFHIFSAPFLLEIKIPVTFIIEKSHEYSFFEFVDSLQKVLAFLSEQSFLKREINIVILSTQEQRVHPSHQVSNQEGEQLRALIRTLSFEFQQINFRVVDTDSTNSTEDTISAIFLELHSYYVTVNQAKEQLIVLRCQSRFVPELDKAVVSREINIPTFPCKLTAPHNNHIDKLSLQTFELAPPLENEVQIQVYYSGLNFRDVLKILGQYPGNDLRLGCEYSGIITKTGSNVRNLKEGQKVAGLYFESLASHINVDSEFAVPVCENINLAAAATLPVCSLSISIPLENIDIPPKSSILIHTASGGLGSFAIAYFSSRNTSIYVTSHGVHKKHYLLSKEITAHADSRSNQYKSIFEKQVVFEDVFIALFTLPSGSVKATLECIQLGGYFIDYTKSSGKNKQTVFELRPDITYIQFDLEAYSKANPGEVANRLNYIYDQKQVYNLAAPLSLYDIYNIEPAFHLISSAKHIGKVAIQWPSNKNIKLTKSILISGGSGFIAEQLAKYYSKTHDVILLSRSASNLLRPSLSALISSQENIHYFETDITNSQQLKVLFEHLEKNFFPLSSIIHAAGEINDGMFSHQDAEQFQSTFSAKCKGAENLHKLSRHIELEKFILISSISSILGSPGQANYATANAYLEALSYRRIQLGLPSKTLLFGPYKDTSMASEFERSLFSKTDIISALPLEQFIVHYTDMLQRPEPVLIHSEIKWNNFTTLFQSKNIDQSLFKKLKTFDTSSGFQVDQNIPKFDPSEFTSKADLNSGLRSLLTQEIESLLEPPPNFCLKFDGSLKEQEIDSLLSVELSAVMEYKLDIEIPASIFSTDATPDTIIDYLVGRIWK